MRRIKRRRINIVPNKEENDDDVDDHNENECSDITNHFTLEVENIIEWVDQHSNAKLTSISQRPRKIKYMYYITRFTQYTENNGARSEKLK